MLISNADSSCHSVEGGEVILGIQKSQLDFLDAVTCKQQEYKGWLLCVHEQGSRSNDSKTDFYDMTRKSNSYSGGNDK